MAAGFYHYILLLLVVIRNAVRSQNNTNSTNSTSLTTTISPNTTVYFTQYPSTSSSPTLTTLPPTSSPTIRGCSDIHGYVQTSLTTIGTNGQITSYPVSYGPHTYRLNDTSMIAFPALTGTEPDPCNTSNFNTHAIANKVVVLDGTLTPINCHYQQWTLNFQSLGAKAVLIGVSSFADYKPDDTLQAPRIPTRLIHVKHVLALIGALCGPGPDWVCNQTDIEIALDCSNNTAPAVICIEDREYDEQYTRITGEYAQLVDSDDNGHPVWQQDKRYNIDENIDWRIYFDMNTYMNWVVGEGTSYAPVAYCNDTITADPTDCNVWYEKPLNSFYQISTELLLEGDLCPAPDPNANSTHFCVVSRSPELTAYTGTYVQQIDGVAEWFYTDTDGVVSYLHWTDFRFMSSSGLLERYGWKINVGTVTKALCIFSELDVSINNSYIQFVPTLCAEWMVGDVVDPTFDIDANVCGIDMDSNVSMLCVASYTIAIDDVYSVWSGVYVMNVTDGYVYNHRLWSFTVDDDMYSILYSQVADAWIVSKADIIYARCADNNNQQNLYDNPTQCSDWTVVDSMSGILLTVIERRDECVVTITTSTETTDSGEAADSGSKTLLADFSVSEFVAIGAALLVFPICIICFVCYQKRKAKKHTHDEGISLQPYVPTGMAYDSYKQSKIHQAQVAKQAKRKKEERDHKRRSRTKLKAPTSVASASVDIGEDHDMAGDNAESTVDSTQALINVFDEDDAMQPDVDDMAGTDTENPFLRDGIIRTGQTIDETHNALRTSDILHAFDES